MGLPWVRLDTNIIIHDKILELVGRKGGLEAGFVYTNSLAFSGGAGTDGYIPKAALRVIHGTDKHARLLVDVRLWEYIKDGDRDGYVIVNYADRQEVSEVREAKRAKNSLGAKKTNCKRYHPQPCSTCFPEAAHGAA